MQTQHCQRGPSSTCGGSYKRCVAACSDTDLHRSLEPAPQRQMLYEMMGRSQEGSRAPFEILWCGRREEYNTWMQLFPCLFWQDTPVMALRHDSRKLKPREREITVIVCFCKEDSEVAERKQGQREGYKIQRSMARIEPGMLRFCTVTTQQPVFSIVQYLTFFILYFKMLSFSIRWR